MKQYNFVGGKIYQQLLSDIRPWMTEMSDRHISDVYCNT